MPKYRVDLPVAGYISVYVEADDEEAAIDKAFDTELHVSFGNHDNAEVGELEFMRQITRGNVLYAPKNRVEVEEVDDAS